MLSQQIRRQFLHFFKEKQHRVIASSPVVPHDDPTLLFTNAGMNQFKDVFLGKSVRDYTRAATAQKCIRAGGKHNDLENVGHTARHLTFFEMLGNFSFGDYFKKDAIAFAWEITQTVFKFEPEKVWITIFREDDESFELWKQWVPEHKIVRMDEKDNFWAMGETGPCGPCSELYFDRGALYGSARNPREDVEGERYLEFWNLVFMQFNREASGKMQPLPKQSIDTGAGLERVVSLKMGVDNVFETDILRGIMAEVETLCGKKYETKDTALAPAFRVIADHLRSLSFAIADGAQPSNVERGYVLRKLVRRCVSYGRLLNFNDPFLAKVLPRLVKSMGEDYPELVSAEHRIAEILTLEEEAFFRTLKRGGNILNSVIEHAQKSPQKLLSGEDAFKLKDTYGLPLEEILLIAKDRHIHVDLPSYEKLEKEAKERSRLSHTTHHQELESTLFKSHFEKQGACSFLGYDTLDTPATVTALIKEGAFVPHLKAGEEGTILLDRTSFYAEKGGQAGDLGLLEHPGATFQVTRCYSPYTGIVAHEGKVLSGAFSLQEKVIAKVEPSRRQGIANNHTATHLLHFALQEVLGAHIRQAGSLVEETRLRFDFNHHKALTPQEIRQVEQLVNDKIRQATPVKTYEISYEEAQKKPRIKQFFGDKYGAKVRVVDIDYSQELCGGTHTDNSAKIGLFRITKESSIAAGVRRVEAVTGKEAEQFMYAQEDLLERSAALLKTPSAKLEEKTQILLDENKHLSHELKQRKKDSLKLLVQELLTKKEQIGSINFVGSIVSVEAELTQELIQQLHQALGSGVILLGVTGPERCQLIAKVSSDLTQKGLQAVQLIQEIASCIEGGGGGKAEMAQAGGKKGEGLGLALDKAKRWLATKS